MNCNWAGVCVCVRVRVCVCAWTCLSFTTPPAFELAEVDISKPTVAMCGGAIVAPFVAFAASLIGVELPVYDVSQLTLSEQWVNLTKTPQ